MTETLREALIDAYNAMDAACRWAAGETAGVKTIADADRHTAGYDALLAGAVKAGLAAGILSGGARARFDKELDVGRRRARLESFVHQLAPTKNPPPRRPHEAHTAG